VGNFNLTFLKEYTKFADMAQERAHAGAEE